MKTEETTTAEASPTVFDTKLFTDGLKAQIKAAGGTAAFYRQNDIIKQLTKATFQVMLDAEMEEHLGYGSNTEKPRSLLFIHDRYGVDGVMKALAA